MGGFFWGVLMWLITLAGVMAFLAIVVVAILMILTDTLTRWHQLKRKKKDD